MENIQKILGLNDDDFTMLNLRIDGFNKRVSEATNMIYNKVAITYFRDVYTCMHHEVARMHNAEFILNRNPHVFDLFNALIEFNLTKGADNKDKMCEKMNDMIKYNDVKIKRLI